MFRSLTGAFLVFLSHAAWGAVQLVDYKSIHIPITPFSNMASGYQATNPGFRAILHSSGGQFLAGGPLTIDAVIRGRSDDASQGSAYGRLVLNVDRVACNPSLCMNLMSGKFEGRLSICMAKDPASRIEETECKDLRGNIHPERPFQWIDKPVEFEVRDGHVTITRFIGYTGEGGTSRQLALAVYHPAYGFAAPGKAFKDYQSPLVLDLDGNGRLDLLNVWSDERVVRFDMNGSGQKVRTGWTSPSDGLLFIDDGSGCVKDGTQLLGEYTGSKDGKRTYENGFEALAARFDLNRTGRVVTSEHPSLKIWRNWGADGVCRPAEVYPASQFAKEIRTDYGSGETTLNEDNEVRLIGSYVANDGTARKIADVWFKQRWNDGGATTPPESSVPVVPVSLNVTNRRPVTLSDVTALRTYASDNAYYLTVNIRPGMKVLYSASYGMGGEAGQASGTIVEKNGRFWFKQQNNPTSQLMLPPGMPFNSSVEHSLWDVGDYLRLVNRVSFSDPNEASMTANDVYGSPAAALVDFKGGTAGGSVTYKDALEVVFNKTIANRSSSDLRVYYAKGIGPVALEFRENATPSGTFKMYLGQ